jgi:ubiquinone/menaquinone biosynthesis C-methylase UbiE
VSDKYDSELFSGAAEYYARYRVPYPQSAIDYIAQTFDLDHSSEILDLGCGPGTPAIPLCSKVKHVLAMDPAREMLTIGRHLVEAAGIGNISWILGGSRDLSADLGSFRLVVMGQSFHWMERDQVLRDLHPLIGRGGGIALVNPGRRRSQESWEPIAQAIVRRCLGPAVQHPQRSPEPEHEPALRRSDFEITARREFPSTIERDIPSILGALYSMSGSTFGRLGPGRARFEGEIRQALLEMNPDGVFRELVETEVLVAFRRENRCGRPNHAQ